MMNEITIQKLKSFLERAICIEVENFGNYLQLTFESFTLVISSAWRLLDKKEISIGSDSEEETLTKLPKILLQKTIQKIDVSGEFNDLRLILDGEIILETFGNSEKYEHWNVSVVSGEMFISGPSNLWSSSEKS